MIHATRTAAGPAARRFTMMFGEELHHLRLPQAQHDARRSSGPNSTTTSIR
jgi:hypothetical protein